jgi:TRAP-type C4-dicarboxylate transport system permease small subunit
MPLRARPSPKGPIVGLANLSMMVAMLTVLAMCLLVTGAVLVRAVFGIPIVWVPEIVGYLMVVLVFLGLGETMLAGGHIRIDLFVCRLPRRLRDVLDLLTLTLSTGVAAFFTWHGASTMLRSYEFGRKDSFGALRMPLYIPQAAMPIGLSILTLVLALLVYRKLGVVLGRGNGPVAEPDVQREGVPIDAAAQARSPDPRMK